MIGFVAAEQPAVVVIVTQVADGPLVNVCRWKKRVVLALNVPSIAPGQAFSVEQVLTTPFRPSRDTAVASAPVMLPETVTGAAVQVARAKLKVFDPPLYVTLSIKDIWVPHTKDGDVLTENGITFDPLLPVFKSG